MKLSRNEWTFKLTCFFILLLSIIQVGYRFALPAILFKNMLNRNDYNIFSRDFKTLILLFGLLLLFSVFLNSLKKTMEPSGIYWIIGFILPLGIIAGIVAFVNPTGRFPWNERDTYISIAARAIKPTLYANLKTTPEIVLLGSSVSFTTPADYLKNKWGVSTFNMSLNGGGAGDFVTAMNYMLQKSPDGKAPLTVLVELLSPGLKIDNLNQTPIKMIPYMPVGQRLPALSKTVDTFFQITPFSDSIFTILFLNTHRWKTAIEFSKDGSGIRDVQEAQSSYQAAIKSNINRMKGFISCKTLDPSGKAYIEELIDLSNQYQFSIIFYRSPINDDFYKASKTSPRRYDRCKKELNNYMMGLTKKNSNVFYKDLSQYAEISTKGITMYRDTHHLKTPAALLLLQTLDAEIKNALEWAKHR